MVLQYKNKSILCMSARLHMRDNPTFTGVFKSKWLPAHFLTSGPTESGSDNLQKKLPYMSIWYNEKYMLVTSI